MDWKLITVVPENRFGFVAWTDTHMVEPEWFERTITSFDLWIVSDGYGKVRMRDGRIFEMKRGSIFHLHPGLVQGAWQQRGREKVSMFWFHHELWKGETRLTREEIREMPIWYETLNPAFYETVARKLLALLNFRLSFTPRETEQRRAEASILLQSLLMDLEHHAALDGDQERLSTSPYRLMVHRLVSRVYQSPELFHRPADLAREAGYSKNHLARVFRQVLGKSPTEVILDARIQKAKDLLSLAHLSLSMGKIAELCGYQNVFYFSNQFRQRTGLSPSGFKRANKASGNIPSDWRARSLKTALS
ncbi:MAG TPA: helix-turn-helix transcriptional regulator [Chthoniobacteraceae bacterium]|nr:helix-turn-helix transcriptional regulator [Chthoniobacteraceae bacterium]